MIECKTWNDWLEPEPIFVILSAERTSLFILTLSISVLAVSFKLR